MPQASQVRRLICVEGWNAIGKWGGVPLHVFLRRIGADLSVRYVGFRCADDYYTSIDMLEMFVTNAYPGGYWEDKGYNWFGGS